MPKPGSQRTKEWRDRLQATAEGKAKYDASNAAHAKKCRNKKKLKQLEAAAPNPVVAMMASTALQSSIMLLDSQSNEHKIMKSSGTKTRKLAAKHVEKLLEKACKETGRLGEYAQTPREETTFDEEPDFEDETEIHEVHDYGFEYDGEEGYGSEEEEDIESNAKWTPGKPIALPLTYNSGKNSFNTYEAITLATTSTQLLQMLFETHVGGVRKADRLEV